jgi:hypothetical protein
MSPDAPTCPDCGAVVERHWSITMTDDQAEVWLHDDTVCARARDEVRSMLDQACCEPDYDAEKGTYDHARSCQLRRLESQ